MKFKTALVLLLLAPFVAMAAPANFLVKWDPYPTTTATMHVLCAKNTASLVELGTVPATTSSLQVGVDVSPGDTVNCAVIATTSNGDTSDQSNVGSAYIPKTLAAPTHVTVTLAK